ncbi:hypothetical protein BJY24_002971 [Nocardia transvalensis]|uniref:Hsp70 protein n=1 Tax=Nocardia transvalensis TaxID=37333 RepID=A0A7W9UI74_9NOCA|nr:Hsp70 family protein [Nocardia transvalensis]MBB5914104.1 hypothetical protein [Nocardia transvalensis]
MAQGLALGITVGSSRTVAVTTSGAYGAFDARVRPSAPPGVSDGFLSRVGDPVDILTADGVPVAAADLVATAIIAALDGNTPAATVVAYPTWWRPHAVAAQREALERAGLDAVTLVPEATAVHRLAAEHDPSERDTVVYDLGSTGLTVSVAGPTGDPRGEPVRSEDVSGTEFDLLLLRDVLANTLGDNDFDPFDPVVERELSTLRHRCEAAKRELSEKTATVVEVSYPGRPARDIRLVRDDLEELLRPPLTESMALVHEALRRAGITPDAVGRILLAGGGGAIPLLTELISAEFGIPPTVAPTSAATAAAHGAALLAVDLAEESTETVATPLVPAKQPTAETDPQKPTAGTGPTERTEDTALPSLPVDTADDSRRGAWKRLALIGGVAVAVAALTTGTLALGTAVQTSTPPASSSPVPAAADGTTTAQSGDTTRAGAATSAAAGIAQRDGTTAAAAPVAAVAPAPGSAPEAGGAPAAAAPAAPNNPGAAPAAPNAPAPPPVSAPTAPPGGPSLPSAPTAPAQPGGLGNTLGNTLDQTGDTLGTVLDAPGRILERTGG